MTTEPSSNTNPRRKTLYSAVAAVCAECGFTNAEKAALETLTEMLQSLLFEIGRHSRAFAEVACRTEPIVGDVVMALIESGFPVESLITFSRRNGPVNVPIPGPGTSPQIPKILQAGQKRKHPSHILEHFPAFPDPHAYIRTATYKQPITDYYTIRDKAASQKRDVERALTRFVAKTGETRQTLFYDEGSLFPLISCKPLAFPYLCALLPKDQFCGEEDDSKPVEANKTIKQEVRSEENSNSDKKEEVETETIDNPYLRSIKLPKKKKR